ncbi:amino acid adenylation domain-containing protein [Pseudomonas fulva]|nr:amino acid adenylation domain-containing protein [Pseudomonas fulva]MBF8778221.1 amino acid adenylation domain-containing protein [Pseudomonas fulva]
MDVGSNEAGKWAGALEDEPLTVTELFHRQVRATPQRIAVISQEGALTFAQLRRRSQQAACLLRQRGVRPGDCVGIHVEPSLDLMVVTLAILEVGGAYLPLAPDYPRERLRYMIQDAGLKLIFTQPALREGLLEMGLGETSLVCEALDEQLAANDALLERPEGPGPGSLAYVIYTSGTTGQPKGVEIEHRSLVSQLTWLRQAHGVDQTQTLLRKTPMSFDAAQWELLAVALGTTVVMGEPGIHRDPAALVVALRRYAVSLLQCVPTLLQALVDEPGFAQCRTLRTLFSGGEPLTRKLALACLDTLPGSRLVNLYGPTECTINASSLVVDRATLVQATKVVSIGFPAAHTCFHLFDPHSGALVREPGALGELYIGGRQLARGYLGRAEQTAERFVERVIEAGHGPVRLYRSGDLASWNADGSMQFIGRADNQVKLRGYRIELDEVRVAIENHPWVKSAAVFVDRDRQGAFDSLLACVALNPREALLMDQGSHGAHHLSKSSRVQVRAQLAQLGGRDASADQGRAVIRLACREGTAQQRARAFARKTYRFFEGGPVSRKDVLDLLCWSTPAGIDTSLASLTLDSLGELLRNLGPFHSQERLLPKYAYASPGALYAHQLYLEIDAMAGLRSGIYYFAALTHELVLMCERPSTGRASVVLHLVGKASAIEAVYRNNVAEVLEMEAGHVLGLLDHVLPEYGLGLAAGSHQPHVLQLLACGEGDQYLGSYALVSHAERCTSDPVRTFVQSHPGRIEDLPAGLYRYQDQRLEKCSDELIQKKDVIAINQRAYEQASFGVSLVIDETPAWERYIHLGRRLQRLQMNDLRLGLMSSGYSSKSGHDLETARRLRQLLARQPDDIGASYFALAGRVSEEQLSSEGMKEDAVHIQGPAELLRQELEQQLPDYMVPNQFVVLDQIPLTANGKVDVERLKRTVHSVRQERIVVQPRSLLERRIAEIWQAVMPGESTSVIDDFFEAGGNSLLAVVLINRINRTLGTHLALQAIFAHPTIEALAAQVASGSFDDLSRLVGLNPVEGQQRPIFCWPGLGGYPMNLRALAREAAPARPFYGIQAFGINPGEQPYSSLAQMAREDVALLRCRQPKGPYTLWGYSFGARVAFEVARQLENEGERIDELVLIAPGNPRARPTIRLAGQQRFADPAFLAVLHSVFVGALPTADEQQRLERVRSKPDFLALVSERMGELDAPLAERICEIVELTYEFKYSFAELVEHPIQAPVTLVKATGDDDSFLEEALDQLNWQPRIMQATADHYQLLRASGISELLGLLRQSDPNLCPARLA